jgi:hypothetical protein
MKRRDFIKALGIMGASLAVPPYLREKGFMTPAQAAGVSEQAFRNARQAVLGELNFEAPSVLPTVINIFMYGGPSELAGNLTNIAEINAKSQNPYPNAMLQSTADGGQITPNGFWSSAGGAIMEELIASGDMSIYRTINRVIDDSKTHRTSIFSAQQGSLSQETPGMGTTVAAILNTHYYAQDAAPFLPFVSFEGESVQYNLGDINLPLTLKPVSLDRNFKNPYSRSVLRAFSSNNNDTADEICTIGGVEKNCDAAIEELAKTIAGNDSKFQKIQDGFSKRKELDDYISQNLSGDINALVPADTDANGNRLVDYTGSFGANVRAAMVLAIQNSDTRFITLSTGGLGGWDDHDNSLDKYTNRVQNLMSNMRSAVNHMRIAGRNDIIINVFGEFGRNVNLNGSMGWDHGNNMNLYTFGGSAVRPTGALGKIVGKTKWTGREGQNRQFTAPTDDSYQAEPMSIAATIYGYFGVKNPQILTAGEDDRAPNGFGPIDETTAGEPLA